MDDRLNIVLHFNQKKIHESPARYKVIKAGKQFGKTKWAVFEVCRKAGLRPNGIFWYVAPSYRQCKSIAWHELKWILPPRYVKKYLETELVVELINGARIELKGADNPDSLRGVAIDGVVYDEDAYIDPYLHDGIVQSQLIAKGGFAYWISTPNQEGKNHFSARYDDALVNMKNGDKDWAAFYFTIWDNPTLSPVEIAKVKDRTRDYIWQVEYMAIESELAGARYPEYKESVNVGECLRTDLLHYRFLDWGLDHPTVVLWAGLDLESKIVYIYQELFLKGHIIQSVCELVNQMGGGKPFEWSVIDPSAARRDQITGRSVASEFIRWGVPVVTGDRSDRGYDITAMYLKKGMVKISPRCKNLIIELRDLQRTDRDGDDCTDALRYGLTRIHDFVNGMNILDDEKNMAFERMKKSMTAGQMSLYDQRLFSPKQEYMGNWVLEELN